MQIESKKLIEDLLDRIEQASLKVNKFKTQTPQLLNHKAAPGKWSALECLEHLNLYGDFYLPEIERRILATQAITPAKVFRSGVLGNYFANLMLAENGNMKKMKSPKDKDPIDSALSITTLDRFLKQQDKLRSLLLQAQNIDMVRTKTAISISNMVRLRLGDTFRFLIYHIERHVSQAERALENATAVPAQRNNVAQTSFSAVIP